MSVEDLKRYSTYPFAIESGPHSSISTPLTPDWVVRLPYDLALVIDGHELKKDNIGGEGFLTAIETATFHPNVESISITFQNRRLSLTEALAESLSLNRWFSRFGFRQAGPQDVGLSDKERGGPFAIMEGIPTIGATKLHSYSDVRRAFLDSQLGLINIMPFCLIGHGEKIELNIVNGRRLSQHRSDAPTGQMGGDELLSQDDDVYYLHLYLVSNVLEVHH